MWLLVKYSLWIVLICVDFGESLMIVGHDYIFANRDFTMVISNNFGKANKESLLELRLEGIDTDGHILLNLTQTVHVLPEANKMVSFKVPKNIKNGNYSIVVEGKGPSNSSIKKVYLKNQLHFVDIYLIGFIIVNKELIEPGDKQKIFVMVMDFDARPPLLNETTLSVYVRDPNHYVIQKWINITLYNGIFQTEITIPALAMIGTYIIEGNANGAIMEPRLFEVTNYDLHPIHLNIYPTFIPLKEHQALNLTVDVKNYFGKSVNGTLNIDVERKEIYSSWTWNVNGLRQIYIPLNETLLMSFKDSTNVKLNLAFSENYTKRKIIKERLITVYDYKYNVRLDNARKLTYRPGSPFKVKLKVTLNGEPAKNVTLLVQVDEPHKTHKQNCTSNMNGDIIFSMGTNASTDLRSITVYEGNHLHLETNIYALESASNMFIDVEILTRIKFNRMMRLLVTCSHKMTILQYYAIRMGTIVEFRSFRPNQMNRYVFEVLVSNKFTINPEIMVATIVNNTLLRKIVDVSFDGSSNPVEIKIEENISVDGVDAGDEIELSVRAQPGSFVLLRAVDKRFENYWDNHEISQNQLIMSSEFIDKYDTSISVNLEPFVWFSDDTRIVEVVDEEEYYGRGIYPDDPRFGMPGPYRTDFWHFWLWQNVTIPSSGRIQLVVNVPHTITSWSIAGVSTHPKYGLGGVTKSTDFETTKILYIMDYLPNSIKRGETVTLHFTLFSTLPEAFEATATMFNGMNQMLFVDRPAGGAAVSINVTVFPNTDTPIAFVIKPLKLGDLEIRMNASIMQGVISDSFRKIIRVIPEDIELLKSESIPLHPGTPSNQSSIIPLFIDEKAEEDSVQINYTIYPDKLSSKDIQNNYDVWLLYGDINETISINPNTTIKPFLGSRAINFSKLCVIVTGYGSGIMQVNWQYRLNLMNFRPRFNLQMNTQATPTSWLSRFEICVSFIPESEDNLSNGTLVEVSIPIGYAMDSSCVLEDEKPTNPISEIEIQHAGTTMLVYFNNMGNETTCFSVFAYRRYRLPLRRPSYIKVQDIYRPALNAMKLFEFY